MKYMLMIYGNHANWDTWTRDDYAALEQAHGALIAELTASGELIATEGLTTAGAKVVRVRDGVPAVTDGPYSEAKEMLAGYYLIECDSVERATEIAARLPEAASSLIEVRRIMDTAEIYGA
ncbi:hypothetical protein HNP84_009380 [Thermocatellispora tengchongensis]|uniref:YCII-related domain-containing protein n=1 Tax=Thermocatellispora tengchongensis TaxID=1073253 RepID=A0A840PL23_9ACTN|nr:hypothetical protein [Thermocatellispora tengchongensis]